MIDWILKMRERLLIGLVERTKPLYAGIFKKQKEAWAVSVARLETFPSGSLGRELAGFLKREGLELMPKLEDHDILHVLLHYRTTVVDEARMQFFLLGNRKRSLYAIACAVASVFLIPEHLPAFCAAFREGRRCANVWAWDFRHLLHEPITVLRALLYRKNLGEEAPFIV